MGGEKIMWFENNFVGIYSLEIIASNLHKKVQF